MVLYLTKKVSLVTLNRYSKLSPEYFEAFFIIVFYQLLRFTVKQKYYAYVLDSKEMAIFFQKRLCIEIEIIISFIAILVYFGLVIFMTIYSEKYATFLFIMTVGGFIPIIVSSVWIISTNFKFSGKPIINPDAYKIYLNVSKKIMIWGVGRMAKALISLRLGLSEFEEPDSFSWSACVLCLLSNLFGEVFPIF